MHNRLIFLYHRVRANPKSVLLGGCLRTNPDQMLAGSEGGTQEGKSDRAMVVPGYACRGSDR
jgi:hypothetical protein